MAMKKRLRTRDGSESKVRQAKGELPPAENGIMRPDTGGLRMPSDLNDEDKGGTLLPDRVVLFITLLALLFIAAIAWFVSRMPPK